MPGVELENSSDGSTHLHSSSSSPSTAGSPSHQTIRNRVHKTASDELNTTESSSLARPASCDSHVMTANGSSVDDEGVKKFTSKQLSELCHRHNAHVAYRGKVRVIP